MAVNAPSPPPPQVTQVLCCKNTVGHLKHTANDRHHEAIKVIALVGGGWSVWWGTGGKGWDCYPGPGSPGGWLQELSEN